MIVADSTDALLENCALDSAVMMGAGMLLITSDDTSRLTDELVETVIVSLMTGLSLDELLISDDLAESSGIELINVGEVGMVEPS